MGVGGLTAALIAVFAVAGNLPTRAAAPAPPPEIAADPQPAAMADDPICGRPPEKLGDSYLGAENLVEQSAHDPRSVDFVACSDAIKEPPPACWTTMCKFRAKNGFGAQVLSIRKFSSSPAGWRIEK